MMKKIFTVMLVIALIFGLMISSASAAMQSCDGRVTGGGQLREESGQLDKKGNDINFKVSFGISARVVNGEWKFNNTTVQFHNVSNDDLDGGKFKGQEIIKEFLFFENDLGVPYADKYLQVARFYVLGKFNGEDGYKMIIRIEDAGEPGRDDNIRIELFAPDGSKLYDTYPNDFPGESSNVGSARHKLDKGNFQVRGCMCEPDPIIPQ